jgi:hypothetical protein
MKLLIYITKVSNRSRYIFEFIFNDLLGLEISLTDNKDEFLTFEGPKFSYAEAPLKDEMFIRSNGLLSETGVSEKEIEFFTHESLPAFFATRDERSVFPFDLFALSFFLVVRYEEYLPFKQDEYGRYPVLESTASRGGFLRIPLVNLWVEVLAKELQKRFPGLKFKERKFKFVPSIDIDHAYAYRHRNFFRTVGGIGHTILKRRWRQLAQRIKVLMGLKPDPYDTYDYIHKVHKAKGMHPLFFILYSQKSRHDNNVTLTNKVFRELLRSLNHQGVVGVHPSLGSNRQFTRLESEVMGLTEALGRKITISRQHFLKVSFPKTYQNLINVGIHHDYSMGYAAEPGFKASVADPFKFYNLVGDSVTNLIIHPLTLMDVTLRDYYRLDPGTGIELAKSLIDATKAVNGEFVCLWHNENFSETGRWKGWREVYEQILSYAMETPKEK